MGGLVFTFFAGDLLLGAEDDRLQLNERLGKIHFWTMFISFNSTFFPLFAAGFLGQPRRASRIRSNLQFLNDWVSVSAFVLGALDAALPLQLRLLARIRPRAGPANPWGSKSIEWQLPSPVPVHNFDRIPVFTGDPYGYGEGPRRSRSRRRAGREGLSHERARASRRPTTSVVESEPPEILGRNLTSAGHLLASATAFFFLAFLFAYFYLRSLNNAHMWRPKGVDPSVGARHGRRGADRRQRAARPARARRPPRRPARSSGGSRALLALVVGLAALVAPVRRVGDARLRARRRRLRERLRRLDGVLLPLRARDALLARDAARDLVPLPRQVASGAPEPGEASGDPHRSATTSTIRSRSSGRSSRRSPSTGRSSRASASSPGSSSTSSSTWPCRLSSSAQRRRLSTPRRPGPRRRPPRAPWREASFYAGVARAPRRARAAVRPLADESSRSTWRSTCCCSTVAPPLIVLGRPWPRMWMPFPRGPPRGGAELAVGPRSAPLRAAARVLTRPPVAFAVMSTSIVAWHIPALYDAAVRNNDGPRPRARALSRTALLFWAPLLEAPPVRARIDHLRRAARSQRRACPAGSSRSCSRSRRSPLYGAYAALQHRPGRPQRAGRPAARRRRHAGPRLAVFFVAIFVSVYRWLEPASPALDSRPEELSWTRSRRTSWPARCSRWCMPVGLFIVVVHLLGVGASAPFRRRRVSAAGTSSPRGLPGARSDPAAAVWPLSQPRARSGSRPARPRTRCASQRPRRSPRYRSCTARLSGRPGRPARTAAAGGSRALRGRTGGPHARRPALRRGCRHARGARERRAAAAGGGAAGGRRLRRPRGRRRRRGRLSDRPARRRAHGLPLPVPAGFVERDLRALAAERTP